MTSDPAGKRPAPGPVIEGPVARVMVVEARFYPDLADEMAAGARAALEAAGAASEWFRVPGALELPAAIAAALLRHPGHFDGFVALGSVIRGGTDHYEHVCRESMHGLTSLATRHGLALGNGLLTVATLDQAWSRARRNAGDKGGDAARACLHLIAMHRALGR